jgi:glycosylphosphatidylinositol transamidase (GPIT) subunit GPI8
LFKEVTDKPPNGLSFAKDESNEHVFEEFFINLKQIKIHDLKKMRLLFPKEIYAKMRARKSSSVVRKNNKKQFELNLKRIDELSEENQKLKKEIDRRESFLIPDIITHYFG